MRLAPLYQEDRARAIQEGENRGKIQGKIEGKIEGKTEEALSLIQRLLTKKLGNINPELMTTINQLNLESLERLVEDLIDFTSQEDLENWLRNINS
jgi:predicted transposase YdaD